MFIQCIGGAKEVSVGKSSCFQLLEVQGSALVASAPQGLILDARNPKNARTTAAPLQKDFQIVMLASKQLLFAPKSLLKLPPNFLKCFLPKNP